jgi:hypothetical protein
MSVLTLSPEITPTTPAYPTPSPYPSKTAKIPYRPEFSPTFTLPLESNMNYNTIISTLVINSGKFRAPSIYPSLLIMSTL